MITWLFDFVLLLCLVGCAPSNFSANGRPDKCNQCTCEPCSTSTKCPDTTCPTQNPSTPVCSCPTIESIDCPKCSSSSSSSSTPVMTTKDAITTVSEARTTETILTTPQTKTTAAITTPTTSSSYPEQAEQESSLCSDNQAPSPGAIIGAAIGGTIFGSIMTAIIFVYFCRTSKNPYNSKKDQTSRTVRNAAYGHSIDNDQVKSLPVLVNSGYSEINDGMRKSAVISPIMRQEDFSKIDEVYNHLGESEKEDRSDYYDHAGPAPSLSVLEDGYGVLSVESGGNDNYNTVDENYSTDRGESMTAENKQSDDYFILESQNK